MPTAFVTGGSGFIGGRLVGRLRADGWDVRALARSEAAAAVVEERGATAVLGDLSRPAALRAGAEGCDVAFHAAAQLGDWGRRDEFVAGNVVGTRNVARACREAGVERFVHVSTEAVLNDGGPLIMADERAPLQPHSRALYSATKAQAEIAVLEEGAPGFDVVIVRPRFVWGAGDTTLLPLIVRDARAGRWAWVGGGRHLTSTTHVDNVVEGLVLAAARGAAGGVYFVTDGTPHVFREFLTRLLATQGVALGGRSMPRPVAAALTVAGEAAWTLLALEGQPPLTRLALWLTSRECTLDITRARTELGYAPVTTVDEGMKELEDAHRSGS